MATSAPPSPEDRLDSWKEIAAYLKRGVRTVQRWEQLSGLPVHRLELDRQGSVFAYKQELDAWWASRRQTSATADGQRPPDSAQTGRRRWIVLTAVSVVLIVSAGVGL